jgi:hypothetical protein
MATADVLQRPVDEEEEEAEETVDERRRQQQESTLTRSSADLVHRQQQQQQQRCQQHETWLLRQTGLETLHDVSMLRKLDLPNCQLTSLPENLAELLPQLEILFCPQNQFSEVPEVIGQCRKLRMVSFRECQIRTIPPEALQPQLQWLILTGNQLQSIPETMGRCVRMQKLMLSGNRLHTPLPPDVVSKLQNLELIRLACNQFTEPPTAMLQLLPNLRWAALASNPFLNNNNNNSNISSSSLPILDDPVLEDVQWPILGQGAGGVTRKVTYNNQPVAVKTFVGQLTSDGSPQDEKAISVQAATSLPEEHALIQLLGETKQQGALVMEYLQDYHALAGPPSFETCSRDVYPPNIAQLVSPDFAWNIVLTMLRVLSKLHGLGICHADFYAHNILICPSAQTVKLSDFGAAFVYDTHSDYGKAVHRVELRAYTVLVQELYDLCVPKKKSVAVIDANAENDQEHHDPHHSSILHPWTMLLEECQKPEMCFADLVNQFLDL